MPSSTASTVCHQYTAVSKAAIGTTIKDLFIKILVILHRHPSDPVALKTLRRGLIGFLGRKTGSFFSMLHKLNPKSEHRIGDREAYS